MCAEIILDILKEEILQYVAIKNQTLTINDILEEINSKERRKDKRQKDKRTNTVLVKGHNSQNKIPQKQFNRRARYSDLIGRILILKNQY
jgi:hypothetical protein